MFNIFYNKLPNTYVKLASNHNIIALVKTNMIVCDACDWH